MVADRTRSRPRPLPSSTVPFRRDPRFVDRQELREIESRSKLPASRLALVGLGGVGYVQRYLACLCRGYELIRMKESRNSRSNTLTGYGKNHQKPGSFGYMQAAQQDLERAIKRLLNELSFLGGIGHM